MKVSISQYASMLVELGESGDAQTVTRFRSWLARRGESALFPRIAEEACRILRKQSGIESVRITTAHQMDDEAQAVLRVTAQKLFPAKTLEAIFCVNESMIGGAKIESDEVLFDASLAYALKHLSVSIMK